MMTESTIPKPFVFVLMPFEDKFNDIYHLGIKEAAADAGGYCERVDEQIYEERILDRIYNQINKADVIVADLTGRNPNVFYETGYAHALNKRVILLTQESDDIPFDLKHHFHIVYNASIVTLKTELTKRLRWYFSNPSKIVSPNFQQLEFYIDNQKIEEGKIIYTNWSTASNILRSDLYVYNASNSIFHDYVKLGILVDSEIGFDTGLFKLVTPSRHGNRKLYISKQTLDEIFPRDSQYYSLIFYKDEGFNEIDISLLISTELGTGEIIFTLARKNNRV